MFRKNTNKQTDNEQIKSAYNRINKRGSPCENSMRNGFSQQIKIADFLIQNLVININN